MPYYKWTNDDERKGRTTGLHHLALLFLLVCSLFFCYSNARIAWCMAHHIWQPFTMNMAETPALVCAIVMTGLYMTMAIVVAWSWWRNHAHIWLFCVVVFVVLFFAEALVWDAITIKGP